MYWHGLYLSFKGSRYRNTPMKIYWGLMTGNVYYAGEEKAQNLL
jgi:hypothetical protein